MLKKIFLLVVCALLSINSFILASPLNGETDGNDKNWEILIASIMKIESVFNQNIVSANGQCVGILQITPIVVKDCNRILKEKHSPVRYTLKDRYDKDKSIEMFNIIQEYYNPSQNTEKAIRLWNGGSGYTKKKTEKYYQKVIKEYNKRLNNN